MKHQHNFNEYPTSFELHEGELALIRLHHQSKTPVEKNWQERPVTLGEIDTNANNVGLLLGERTGFIDIDCDSREAVFLADRLLADPTGKFKRSDDSAHYIYRSPDCGATQRRDHDGTLIELRSNGSQTMIPPSIHPSGEPLIWQHWDNSTGHQPYDALKGQVDLIAATCLVIREYHEGARHYITLGFAGLLRKAGIDKDLAETVIQAVAEFNVDEELASRIGNVRTTYAADDFAGYSLLEQHLDGSALGKICQWLGVTGEAKVGEVLPAEDIVETAVRELSPDTISEAVLAGHFAPSIKGKFCYVPENNGWSFWNGVTWQRDDRRMLSSAFMKCLEQLSSKSRQLGLTEALKTFETSYKADSVAKLCQSRRAVEVALFDSKNDLLNCPNGVIDLKTGNLKTHNPLDYLTKKTAAAYNPDATAPKFEKFVLEICDDDKCLAEFLRRVAGYALEGGNPEQAMFILHGSGANGKSTFVEVCSEVLGAYAKTAPSSVLVEGRSGGVGDDLVFLKGARWINASETGQGAALAENKLKQITGGDTIAGRALYAAHQEFQIDGMVLFSTNHLPKVRGRDEGIWRRLNVIEFKRRFSEEERDPQMKENLLKERSGILNWMLEGHRQYKEGGLQPPICVKEANLRYRQGMDVVSGFLDSECEFNGKGRTHQTDLRWAFKSYCEEQGWGDADWRDLKATLEERGLGVRRSNGQRLWSGISLKAG